MPWKESDKVTERMRFIARHEEGERISDLCQEFGISRQTAHAVIRRYQEHGPKGLEDRSSRPFRSPHRTPRTIAEKVIALRTKRPTWGPKKLKSRLHELEPEVNWPAASTIGAILADAGLVGNRKRRRRASPNTTGLRTTQAPNELWCMDYKGQFRLGNRSYCYPFTVTDHQSRFLLCCDALENTKTLETQMSLRATFAAYGLPAAIRSDNGSPFASTGRAGLTTLSVWLMRCGVGLERIEPGKPQQNGRHERMHLTLKQDTTRPAAHALLGQQEKFDQFRQVFNEERPHEALDMKPPATMYRPSTRKLPDELPPLEYPLHDATPRVARNGSFYLPKVGHAYLTTALAHQRIGLRHIESHTWLVSFMDLDIGYLDTQTNRVIDIPSSD